MRIGVDIRALMEGKTTGVEVYLVNLLRELFAIDKQNEYILFANSFRKIRLPKFDYPNVKMKVTRYPNKLFNLGQKLGFPKIEKLIGPIDLFFSPHWRAVALQNTTPLVITFHDLFFELMPEFFTWRRRLWHKFMNYRKAASRANKIIAVSENTKRDLMRLYGIDEKKIEVVYSGVRPLPASSHPPQAWGGVGGEVEKYFLYLGTFEPRKNIEAVIAAYAQYRKGSTVNRKLVLAGNSGWKTRPDVSAKLDVEIMQNVSEDQKANLLTNAFAFLFPSYYEGFGFPILEAASYGVPVIASYNSSIAEVGRDFVLFVNSFRTMQIATAMLQLEQDTSLYAELKEKTVSTIKKFDWQVTAKQTLAIFNNTGSQ